MYRKKAVECTRQPAECRLPHPCLSIFRRDRVGILTLANSAAPDYRRWNLQSKSQFSRPRCREYPTYNAASFTHFKHVAGVSKLYAKNHDCDTGIHCLLPAVDRTNSELRSQIRAIAGGSRPS